MKYYKDTSNKPFVFEDNITSEIIAKVEVTHSTTLTEITKADYESIITILNTPTQTQINAKKLSEIEKRLAEIDILSIRPLRAVNNGVATTYDTDKLKALDTEADMLRAERMLYVPTI